MKLEWDGEKTERLTQLWSEGLTGSQIAKIIGTTRSAILGKVRRLDLPYRQNNRWLPAKKIILSLPPAIPPPPEPTPEPIKPTVYGAYQAVLALESGSCKYPFGHPNKPDFHFCSRPVKGGFVYCEEHAKACYKLS